MFHRKWSNLFVVYVACYVFVRTESMILKTLLEMFVFSVFPMLCGCCLERKTKCMEYLPTMSVWSEFGTGIPINFPNVPSNYSELLFYDIWEDALNIFMHIHIHHVWYVSVCVSDELVDKSFQNRLVTLSGDDEILHPGAIAIITDNFLSKKNLKDLMHLSF